jgi:hypothetical protein
MKLGIGNQLCDEKHVDSKYEVYENVEEITENQIGIDENIYYENTKKEKCIVIP